MRTKQGDKETDILKAAIEVFGKQGFAKAKMHHIADKAGIGIGTVYLYFKNKETIVLRIFELVWNELLTKISCIRRRSDMASSEKLNALIDAVFDYFAHNPLLALVFVNEQQQVVRATPGASFLQAYENTLLESERIIAEGQQNGSFNRDIPTEFFRHFFFGGIRYLLLQWAAKPKTIAIGELKENIKKVMLNGIAQPSTTASGGEIR
jgi:TetR/AcrR family fatty acid metabolism transcriptional regulator